MGDHVSGLTGFQEYFQGNPKLTGLQVIPKFIPMDQALAVFSHIGATSYIGMLEIGQPKEGETVVVTAAAGAVGSLAVQMAKIKGTHLMIYTARYTHPTITVYSFGLSLSCSFFVCIKTDLFDFHVM